jgi:AbrB family looped-hinge helix DNA binding protein
MDLETRMRVNENGRVVIPASYRKALGINVGDEVLLRIEDDELRITTLADELIAERREAAERE